MANVTWNPSDKTVSVTLTGSNLTATSGSSQQGVRATDRQWTGKFYWEVTGISWAASANRIGIGNANTTLGGVALANTCVLGAGGGVTINNGGNIVNLGSRSNGDVIGIAIDLGVPVIWFRVSPAGNWNANAGNNPATGVGGINISAVNSSGGIPVYPYNYFAINGDSVRANFGDTAFTGTTPAGFTAGFPTGGVPPGSGTQAWAMVLA